MNSEKARHFLEVFFSERFPGDDGVSGQMPGYHNHRRLLLIGLASAHHALGDAAASDAALRGMIEK